MKNLMIVVLAYFFSLFLFSCDTEKDGQGLPSDVDRILLLLDNETGFGGFITQVYNPYVFYKDGTFLREPIIPLDEINKNALTNEQAKRWGTYERNGDKVNLVYSNGNRAEKDWNGNTAYEPTSNEKIDGRFSTISGGGNLAWGGSVGILSYSRMAFTNDGFYTTERISGVNSSNLSAYNTDRTSGRYSFDGGYSITLTANNGQSKRFFFCWYSRNNRNFRLGGRTFSIQN